MTTRARLLIAIMGVLLLHSLGDAQAQAPIFRMDCGTNGSAWPKCGWQAELTDCAEGRCTKTRIPGGSPSGKDSARIEGRLNPPTTGQYDYGWFGSYRWLNDTRPRGARYVRWRIKLLEPVKWRDHVGGAAASKLLILGNVCDDRSSRIISNIGPESGGANRSPTLDFWTDRNINNGDDGQDSQLTLESAFVPNRWLHVQIAAIPGVGLRQWVNNNDVNKPNGRTKDSRLTDTNWHLPACELHFGSTMAALGSEGSIRFELADFEYDDRFDPTWHLPADTPR